MSDDRKVMRIGLVIAVILILVRIALEQVGTPESVNNIFGVAWLYVLLPALFGLGIRASGSPHPYGVLLKDVVIFSAITRVMVAITYALAYWLKWSAPRFQLAMGGNVGDNVTLLNGLLMIPMRNAMIWVIMATIVGMLIGSIALLLTRKQSKPAAA